MKIYKLLAIGLLVVGMTSCGEDFLDTDYNSNLSGKTAIELAAKDPSFIKSYIDGIWSSMVETKRSQHDSFSYMSVLHSTDMMTEDMLMAKTHWFLYDYALDNRTYTYRRTSVDWITFYTMITKANEIMDFFPNGAEVSAAKTYLGQAYAVRGLAYYYLIQLYQHPVKADGTPNLEAPGVPIMLSAVDSETEEQRSTLKGRNTVQDVYNRIESDLVEAVKLLGDADARTSKNEINVDVANGILARYYLLSQKWQKAADAAAEARKNTEVMDKESLHDGFMNVSNASWMWGFNHNSETSTIYASFFSHISNYAPGYGGLDLSARCIDKRLYETMAADDERKKLFNGSTGWDASAHDGAAVPTSGAKNPYANLKFGSTGDWTMDYIYMRAAEMVLIQAEALAHLGQNTQAATVLRELMSKRSSSWNKTSVTVDDVWVQRRLELWGEGFSYFDLKRLNKGIDRTYTGTNHLPGKYRIAVPAGDVKWIYQIPLSELQENDMISTEDQNP